MLDSSSGSGRNAVSRVARDPFSKFDARHPTPREGKNRQVTIIMPSDQLGVNRNDVR